MWCAPLSAFPAHKPAYPLLIGSVVCPAATCRQNVDNFYDVSILSCAMPDKTVVHNNSSVLVLNTHIDASEKKSSEDCCWWVVSEWRSVWIKAMWRTRHIDNLLCIVLAAFNALWHGVRISVPQHVFTHVQLYSCYSCYSYYSCYSCYSCYYCYSYYSCYYYSMAALDWLPLFRKYFTLVAHTIIYWLRYNNNYTLAQVYMTGL